MHGRAGRRGLGGGEGLGTGQGLLGSGLTEDALGLGGTCRCLFFPGHAADFSVWQDWLGFELLLRVIANV